MTRLQWNTVGERRFETGVDRGVLYLLDGRSVPWNGLTMVGETMDQEVKPVYLDGVKFLDHHVGGSYTAKLQAFTYPNEFEELTGVSSVVPGVFLHDQKSKLFHLSYRTLVGNDLQGIDHGYKIHLLYNLLAVPSDLEFESVKDTIEPKSFEWTLTGTPPRMFGARPTNHISLDSRLIAPELLQDLEGRLYGTGISNPHLPSLVQVIELVGG
jgi:hypothetical protein